ncbi:hypothetical protein EMCRGX_G032745 [Ephydatia muelleri]
MEGLLCQWALALQEYDFHIEYKKGSSNSNADALSRRPTYQPSDVVSAVRTEVDNAALRYVQEHEPHLNQVLLGLKASHVRPPKWRHMPIGRSWEMIAVDILEVLMSTNGNRYLMVMQDYFTKWAEAIPLKNQTAALINEALVKLCCIFGLPSIIHSDQGRAFENLLLRHTLDAFGIKKSRTTAYHPQGDGMVERFNRSLLQLLRTYVEREEEWECHLSLVLFAYRTAIHSSTGVSPFVMMFGRQPKLPPSTNAFDAMTYSKSLCAKLDHLKDFVDTHLQQAAQHQKAAYDRHTKVRSFQVGQPVWLSVPTAGKLDPRWEGKWKVTRIMCPVTVEIRDGNRVRVVHVNRIQPRLQAGTMEQAEKGHRKPWSPPQVDHYFEDDLNVDN